MYELLSKYLKKYSLQILAVIFCTGCQVICELSLPKIMSNIVDIGLSTGGVAYILHHGSLMLLMSLGQVAAMICIGFLSAKVSSAMGKDLRRDVFVNAQKFSLNELNTFTVSSMIVRNTNDVTTLQNSTIMIMRMVFSTPVLCIGSIILTFTINKNLALVILCAVPVLFLFFGIMIKTTSKLFVIHREKLDKLNLLVREHLSGTRVVRAFVNQATEQKKFEKGNDEIYRISLKIYRIMSCLRPTMMLIINLTTVAVCYFGVRQVEIGQVTVGQLMSLLAYVMQILMSLSMLSFLMFILPRTKVSAKRINEVLKEECEIVSPKECKTAKNDSKTVEFKNVSFAYPDSTEPAIANVSFVAEGGKTTAIIGSTGSGKSTLQRLIIRLYDVTDGSVLVDGTDVRDYELSDLRSKVGYVPQKAVLFSGTVAENVRFGKEEASDKEVEEALKTAQAWSFVSKMEKGINSDLAQGGKNVSGGQKQRLAIARAIIKDCQIVVFDDSFSALDYATDAKLREALSKDSRLGQTTRIIIAQRISTVMNADKIIVMENGKVVGQGKHKELLRNCPLYYEIASSQLSEEELK